MSSMLQQQKAALDRFTENARYKSGIDMEAFKTVERIFNAGWSAALSSSDQEREILEVIAKHAIGLTLGLDWNSGAAANKHRGKLEDAVRELLKLRESCE